MRVLAFVLALLLPWIEIACAAALVVGRWIEEATAVLMAMLAVYIVGIAAAMVRGLDIHCGCFGAYDTSSTTVVLVRDVVFLGIAIGIIVTNRKRAARSSAVCQSPDE